MGRPLEHNYNGTALYPGNEALYNSVSKNRIIKRTENEKGVTESELNNA